MSHPAKIGLIYHKEHSKFQSLFFYLFSIFYKKAYLVTANSKNSIRALSKYVPSNKLKLVYMFSDGGFHKF